MRAAITAEDYDLAIRLLTRILNAPENSRSAEARELLGVVRERNEQFAQAEAEYLRSLIIKWGGTVVIGDQLPGDLDFLVLGLEPPMPLPPPSDATQPQLEDWLRKRRAHEMYQELFRQAREAQIPVLNANRFFILIGYTNR